MILDENMKKLWVYNAGIDNNWQKKECGVKKFNQKYEQFIYNSQAELVLFLQGKNDLTICTRESDEEFLDDMKKLGFCYSKRILIPNENKPLTNILIEHQELLRKIREKLDSKYSYVPYILSANDELVAKELNIRIWGSSSNLVKQIDSKVNTRRIIEDLNMKLCDGFICCNITQLLKGYEVLRERGYTKVAIKEPYNSAGKGVYYIKNECQFNSFIKMLRFPENSEFEVIIEGWIDRKRDINYQIEISKNGKITLLGITEQVISFTSYKGSVYPIKMQDEIINQYKNFGQVIGEKLYKLGYFGIVGIDSFILNDNSIIPAIEINARLNQSTFFYPIMKLFGQSGKRSLVRIYDVHTSFKLSYHLLKSILKKENLYYNEKTKGGILIINSTCLSCYKDESKGIYHSRLFLVYIFDFDISTHSQLMDAFIKKIQNMKMEA